MHPATSQGAWQREWLLPAAVLLAAVLLVYLPTLHASFQFDDFRVVVSDARVHSLAAWWQSMPSIRPLLRLSYAVGHELGGSPATFRVFNTGVHCVNACLVLALLRGMGTRCGLPAHAARHAALLAAALFALHPIATEAVTYISGRSSSLAAMFALCALVLWLRADEWSMPGVARAIAIASGVAAMAVKESAAVFPLAMLLCSVIGPRSDEAQGKHALHPLFLYTATLATLAAFFAWNTAYPAMFVAALERREVLPNLLTQAHGVTALLGHALLPWTVAVELDLTPVHEVSVAATMPFALCVIVLVSALASIRRHPAVAFGVLWIALWLLPTHSVFAREDIANDRQFYLPLVGMAWLLAWLLVRLRMWLRARASTPAKAGRSNLGWPLATLSCLLLAWLSLLTLLQNLTYRTEVSYWEAAVAAAPRNARAANNLGYAYALACRDEDALRAFAIAQRLDPHNLQARMNHALLQRHALFTPGQRSCARQQAARISHPRS